MIWKILGSLFLIKCGLSLAQLNWLLVRLYILPKFGIKLNLKKWGAWAVITGATDGIGKAVAKELAKHGLNIVLISRTEEKLKKVAEEFASLNVQIKTIQFDYSKVDGYEFIKEKLKDLDIGILVNNVGMSYDHPDFYMHYEQELYRNMININITSVLEMTKIVLEGMLQRKKGGLLVHVSSSSSYLPVPLLTVYGSSKAFVNMFSQGLSYEYRREGIKSHVITPYFVATNMSKLRPSGLMIPSAETYAKQMVNSLGLSNISCGYWSHEIYFYLVSLCPNWFTVGKFFKMMLGFQKKWLKKQNQKKE